MVFYIALKLVFPANCSDSLAFQNIEMFYYWKWLLEKKGKNNLKLLNTPARAGGLICSNLFLKITP